MQRSKRQQGAAMIEFLLAATFFLVPLMLGSMSVGFNLLRATEVTQFDSDAAHMYAQGVDFSQSSNQQMLLPLASGLNFTLSGGTGVIIFTSLLEVGTTDCQAGGVANPNSSNCPNLGQVVVTRRIVVGNSSIYTSTYGTPTGMDSSGNIPASTYLFSSGDRATSFSSLLTLSASQVAYLTETYFTSSDYDITGFITGSAVYARGIY